ncbi:type IV pilus assembly protein PilM [Calycomorphotria hydatis]|uniref:Competence protein A n=1 Tax=Calycomorphotria hydatis TaxID=2528027 RepID=A0A517T6X7_9PLAN|nr:type IV pilus assembly protein PilM [Calycomorphotria hydatis]QDT64123.1 Competence protein A [Calycomorphotria hydatis]
MADDIGYWGIEIGQAGLKAIRLKYAAASNQAIAVAFDFVPHPKLLSQPDAIPDELIPQAIETFLSRNDIGSDIVAVAVPGHSALARFIQLPPVESSKVAQIVEYEAKQQIPFALEEVIWDYQTLGSGAEESGFMLDAEVGLFAMKRDLVSKALAPLLSRKVEVELVQIAPLALYNYLMFDRYGARPDNVVDQGDEYHVVCDMGADNTMLVVSNGPKIWIRNVPIGGNHFTRALVKGMKLTFAKAEHLKCNATKSPDPRAVFQTLRPVFNDYVSELQRSIGYFSSVNRDAKIVKMLGVGNGFKLAGLQKFLQQNMQYDVERVEHYDALVGDSVVNDDLFKENILSFVVPYGLAVQAMKQTRITTTLLPPEIAFERKIRRKKPWAVVTAAVLLIAFTISAIADGNVLQSVSEGRWSTAEKDISQFNSTVGGLKGQYSEQETRYQTIEDRGQKLIGDLYRRDLWLEVYRAVNASLPRDTGDDLDLTDITKQNRIRVDSITAERMANFGTWFTQLPSQAKDYMTATDKAAAPTGPGYLFTLTGEHFHDTSREKAKDPLDIPRYRTRGYIAENFIAPLNDWVVELEVDQDQDGSLEKVLIPVRKIGISHATLLRTLTKKVEHPANLLAERKMNAERNLDVPGGGIDEFGPGFGRGGPGGGLGGGGRFGSGRGDRFGSGSEERFGSGRGERFGSGGGRDPRLPSLQTDPNNQGSTIERLPDIDRTTFMVQFVWTPTEKTVRTDTDPNAKLEAVEGENGEGANPDAPADGAATPPGEGV